MMKAWLDENLPQIVEQQVAAEIERVARLRRPS
jgi:cell pole-organizing protein PopZ